MRFRLRRRHVSPSTNPYEVALHLARSGDDLGVVYLDAIEDIAKLEEFLTEAFEIAAVEFFEGKGTPQDEDPLNVRVWMDDMHERIRALLPPKEQDAVLAD